MTYLSNSVCDSNSTRLHKSMFKMMHRHVPQKQETVIDLGLRRFF